MKSWALAVLVVFALPACGGGGGGGGGTPTFLSSAGLVISATSCEGMVAKLSGLAFELGTRDVPDTCSKVADPCFSFRNMKLWSVVIVNYDTTGGTPPAVATGTYTMNSNSPPTTPTGTLVEIGYDMTDASCNSTAGGGSYNPSGTVTITAITATNITGSYDIVVFDGQHLTGSFDVAVCSNLNSFNICAVNSGDFTGTCSETSQCI